MNDSISSTANAGQLRGWKEIGRWFGVDERTVKRWETSRALPVHRVPGKPRAPVYAYSGELAGWMAAQGPADPSANAPPRPYTRPLFRRRWPVALVAAVIFALASGAFWLFNASRTPAPGASGDHVRRLAGNSLTALNARLEQQPRTVRLRAALAEEAAAALRELALEASAPLTVRREAAMAYRRLAIIRSANDRPSLLDRTGAREALERALALVATDETPEGKRLRATLLIDASRHAAADGAVDQAQTMLETVAGLLGATPPGDALHRDWILAASEVAQWRGDYARAIALAENKALTSASDGDADQAFQAVRARDLASEAKFYAGDVPGALAGYRSAAQAATAGAARWPNDLRWTWYAGREQWNVGSTLGELKRTGEAVTTLGHALDHWDALARADPEDESVTTYVRAVRLSYGGALRAAGQPAAAARVLGISVGETREWLARRPGSYERQRAMVVRLSALGDALAGARNLDGACAAYGEAASYIRSIDAAGKLSKLDRDAVVGTLRTNATAACPTLRV